MEDTPPNAHEPRPLGMPPLVLYAGTRPAFLLAWHQTRANNVTQWWGKIAIVLDHLPDEPSVGYRWVDSSNLKKLDGVDYSHVPIVAQRD